MTTDMIVGTGTALGLVGDSEWRLAEAFVKSGFFSDARDAAQAIVKIQAGRELGYGPMASMQGIYIVKGKVSLSANLLGATIKRSGRYDYRVTELTDAVCSIDFFQHGEPIGNSTFTLEDAKRAGLLNSQTWKAYARNMLFARALSNGARWYCPDVFGGPLYTPEELGAEVDGETGEPIASKRNGTSHAPAASNGRVDADVVDGEFTEAASEPHFSERIERAATTLEALIIADEIEDRLSMNAHRCNALGKAFLRAVEVAKTEDDIKDIRGAFAHHHENLGKHKQPVVDAVKVRLAEIMGGARAEADASVTETEAA